MLFDVGGYAKGSETEWFSVNGRNWVVSACVSLACVGCLGICRRNDRRGGELWHCFLKEGRKKRKGEGKRNTVSLLDVAPVFIRL